jgi:hypothetical protein
MYNQDHANYLATCTASNSKVIISVKRDKLLGVLILIYRTKQVCSNIRAPLLYYAFAPINCTDRSILTDTVIMLQGRLDCRATE